MFHDYCVDLYISSTCINAQGSVSAPLTDCKAAGLQIAKRGTPEYISGKGPATKKDGREYYITSSEPFLSDCVTMHSGKP